MDVFVVSALLPGYTYPFCHAIGTSQRHAQFVQYLPSPAVLVLVSLGRRIRQPGFEGISHHLHHFGYEVLGTRILLQGRTRMGPLCRSHMHGRRTCRFSGVVGRPLVFGWSFRSTQFCMVSVTRGLSRGHIPAETSSLIRCTTRLC